jgi:iron(III) transport system permease protein
VVRRTVWLPAILAIGVLADAWAVSDARSRGLVVNTLWLVAATLAISIPIGTALAVALTRTDAWLRRTVAVALGIMLVVPLYLHAAGWEAGFGMSGWFTELTAGPYQAGLLSGWRGAVWVHGMAAIPWVVLIVGTVIRFVEAELEEAALLDASAWQTILRVTLRRALPAIGVAAVWIAVGVATEMTVTDIFQTPGVGLRTFAEEIYTDFALGTEAGPPHAAEIGVAVTGILAACGLMLSLAAASWTPPNARPPLVFRLGRWRGLVSLGLLLAAGAILGVPLISLITKAGETVQHSAEGVFNRGWSVAECLKIIVVSPWRYRWEIAWSGLTAIVAASMVLAVALPIGWLARRRDAIGFVGKIAAILASAAALAVPGPLVGIGLIALFNQPGMPPLNFLYDDTIGVVAIAQGIRAFPLGMLIVWHALHTVPSDLLEAAELDGAGVWTRLVRIVLPLRWPALALAWLAAFVVAIGELSATIVVVPAGVATLGVRISQLLHFNMQNELAGLCLILMAAAAMLAGVLVVLAARSGSARGRRTSESVNPLS